MVATHHFCNGDARWSTNTCTRVSHRAIYIYPVLIDEYTRSRVPSSRLFLLGLSLPLVIVDPRFGEPIQFVQLLLRIGRWSELHFQLSDQMIFYQFERKVGEVCVDALHGLCD